jgi:hypothetical protein
LAKVDIALRKFCRDEMNQGFEADPLQARSLDNAADAP